MNFRIAGSTISLNMIRLIVRIKIRYNCSNELFSFLPYKMRSLHTKNKAYEWLLHKRNNDIDDGNV